MLMGQVGCLTFLQAFFVSELELLLDDFLELPCPKEVLEHCGSDLAEEYPHESEETLAYKSRLLSQIVVIEKEFLV